MADPALHSAQKPSDHWSMLITWDDLPHWRQDNQYIRGSYRRESYSYLKSLGSLAYWHNETINIYSHLIPALLSLPCALAMYMVMQPRYKQATPGDIASFCCFFVGAALCLGMSATYHTITNHSPRVNQIGNQLDYVGIVLLITGSFVPSIYYGFWCDPALQTMYWTMISSLGVGCTIVSVLQRFRTPSWRPIRASMFVALGLSAGFPVLHGLKLYGFQTMCQQMGLLWVILQGLLYVIGAAIYANRVPEKWHPGRYDVIGSSHQIFHVFVVLAAISHLIGLLKAFDFRHGTLGGVCLKV